MAKAGNFGSVGIGTKLQIRQGLAFTFGVSENGLVDFCNFCYRTFSFKINVFQYTAWEIITRVPAKVQNDFISMILSRIENTFMSAWPLFRRKSSLETCIECWNWQSQRSLPPAPRILDAPLIPPRIQLGASWKLPNWLQFDDEQTGPSPFPGFGTWTEL